MTLRRKSLLLAVVILIVAIVSSYALLTKLNMNNSAYTFSKSITRNTSNIEEEYALSVAESIDYADIFNMPPLTGLGFGWQGSVSDYSDYVWAQLVDSKVINYYDMRSSILKGNASITYSYNASVHSWNQIHIAHASLSDNTNSITVLSSNETILFQNSGWATNYAYYNGSWNQPINASEISFDLAESYIIEMDLQYMETYAPLAAFYSHVIQTVILDENYQPRLLATFNSNVIS